MRSRGVAAAHADLVRDWNYRGTDQGVAVKLRTDAELTADLMRDWNGPAKTALHPPRRVLESRTLDAAYNDLVRNWGS